MNEERLRELRRMRMRSDLLVWGQRGVISTHRKQIALGTCSLHGNAMTHLSTAAFNHKVSIVSWQEANTHIGILRFAKN